MILPSSVAGSTSQEVAYFGTSPGQVAAWLLAGFTDEWAVVKPGWKSLDDAARSLTPAAPVSRYAFMDMNGWTVMLNNGPNGTDVGVMPSRAARDLGCRAIRAVCVADEDPDFAARILEVYGPDGKGPLALERSIVAAHDGGRWVFETSGRPCAFEDLDAYQRRRKTERFSCEMLYRYIRCLGVTVDADPDWNGAVLVDRKQ